MEVGETDEECAIREVYEEVGLNISGRIRASNTIAVAIRQHDSNGIKTANTLRLFIIPGINEKGDFRARTQGEISAIQWFSLSKLPSGSAVSGRMGSHRFWLVAPVVAPLREWVAKVKLARRRKKKQQQQQQQQQQQVGARAARKSKEAKVECRDAAEGRTDDAGCNAPPGPAHEAAAQRLSAPPSPHTLLSRPPTVSHTVT